MIGDGILTIFLMTVIRLSIHRGHLVERGVVVVAALGSMKQKLGLITCRIGIATTLNIGQTY